jgi:RNase P subunit RPR2
MTAAEIANNLREIADRFSDVEDHTNSDVCRIAAKLLDPPSECTHIRHSDRSRMIDDEYVAVLTCYKCGCVKRINYTQHTETAWTKP